MLHSNDVKVTLLGVPDSLLEQHGAVSECAIAMATGSAERLSADYGLSITGFAGPEGGNKDNPLGTIHIGYHTSVEFGVKQCVTLVVVLMLKHVQSTQRLTGCGVKSESISSKSF